MNNNILQQVIEANKAKYARQPQQAVTQPLQPINAPQQLQQDAIDASKAVEQQQGASNYTADGLPTKLDVNAIAQQQQNNQVVANNNSSIASNTLQQQVVPPPKQQPSISFPLPNGQGETKGETIETVVKDTITPETAVATTEWDKLGMDKATYDRLSGQYSTEELKSWFGYNPEEHRDILEKIYTSTNTSPEPQQTPKQAKRRQEFANIADALGLLTQVVGYNQGAMPGKLPESAGARIKAENERLDNLYLQRQQQYQKGLTDAKGKDYLNAMQKRREGRKEAQEYLNSSRKLDQDRDYKNKQLELQNRRLDYMKDKDNKGLTLKQAQEEEKKRIANAKLGIEGRKLELAANREKRLATQAGLNKGTKDKDKVTIVINANEADTSQNVRRSKYNKSKKQRYYDMTKGEVVQLASEARTNKDFQTTNEFKKLKTRDIATGAEKWENNDIVASSYLQWKYDNAIDNQDLDLLIDSDINIDSTPTKEKVTEKVTEEVIENNPSPTEDVSTNNTENVELSTTTTIEKDTIPAYSKGKAEIYKDEEVTNEVLSKLKQSNIDYVPPLDTDSLTDIQLNEYLTERKKYIRAKQKAGIKPTRDEMIDLLSI